MVCGSVSAMSNSPTPSRREYLVGRIYSLYADLGWAVPTGIETARLTLLQDSVSVAVNAWERRCAGLPKSATDVHNTIQAVQREERQAPLFEAVGFIIVDVTK
jgi:hypothetical protein